MTVDIASNNMNVMEMRSASFSLFILLTLLPAVSTVVNPAFAYSRIIEVEVHAPFQSRVDDRISVEAIIYTGNNIVEYTHDVQATLLLPTGAKLISGANPVFIGEMGPGPTHTHCNWTVDFEESGRYMLMVNASCLDTQKIPQSMDNSTIINIHAPPYVEFEYSPVTNIYVNDIVSFNATKSYARGPNSQISTYAWDFSDETNVTTFVPVIEHEFSKIGNYTISLNITDDSTFQLSNSSKAQIQVSLFGDINSDSQVNILDITIVATAYNSQPAKPDWNPAADLNDDKIVNIIDLTLVAINYGKTA